MAAGADRSRLKPTLAAAEAAFRARDHSRALRLLRAATAIEPADPAILRALAKCALRLHLDGDARRYHRRLHALVPQDLEAAIAYAQTLVVARALDEAELLLERLRPTAGRDRFDWNYAAAHVALKQRRFGRAADLLRRCLRLVPSEPYAVLYLGLAAQAAGDLDRAIVLHRRAVELAPDPKISSALVTLRDFHPDTTPADLVAERRAWQRRHGGGGASDAGRAHAGDRDGDRRLRVGYLSSYFHRSSGGLIAASVILNHDPATVEPFLYSSGAVDDPLTAAFQGAGTWRAARSLSDAALAEQIRSDRIDLLVDLDGHSPENRLPVFVRKPAPLQLTGWGHAGGTGLSAMDYALVDRIVVPPERSDWLCEHPLYLPCVLTAEPPTEDLDPGRPPVLDGQPVTFGCLNRLTKVVAPVLALWGDLLNAVPDSRLLLKGRLLDDAGQRARVTGALAERGIGAERLMLLGGSSHRDHLACYRRVDIALDSFPMSGGVTTLEALWMGVPVVTMRGHNLFCRLSASILGNIGATELVADSPADYLARAAALAGDTVRLEHYRTTLRDRLAAAPVGNPVRYARAVEEAYRLVWRAWCADPGGEVARGGGRSRPE